MKVLVTGGAGFIGSHLVEHLLERGADVTVLDDFSTGSWSNLAPFEADITIIEGSVTDPAACRRATSGAEFVYHQAALGSVPRSIENPQRTHEVNATGTLNVLSAAVDAGVRRFIYAGSSSAYGATPELPKQEDMPSRPRSPYAVAKLAGEGYCRAFHVSYGLETIALRYFNVFGPRQDPTSQYAAVIPLFVTAAVTGARPVIFGDGEQSRDFTYIDNVVQANLLALEPSVTGLGGVFNVGAGARTTVNELWSEIRALTGSNADPEYRTSRAGDVRHSLAALDRIREALGYEPKVDLGEGLKRTVDWFQSSPAVATPG